MSKADEIKEFWIGYKKSETKDFISYTNLFDTKYRILFDKTDNSVIFEGFNAIDMRGLQAINLKVKELRLDRRRR